MDQEKREKKLNLYRRLASVALFHLYDDLLCNNPDSELIELIDIVMEERDKKNKARIEKVDKLLAQSYKGIKNA